MTWSKAKLVTLFCILAVSPSCSNQERFVELKTTETFVQEYNPHYLDVLWVLDNRSPMRNHKDALTLEAKELFSRIGNSLGEYGQYRMSVTSTDGRPASIGNLLPSGQILVGGLGTLDERVAYFGNMFAPLLNLATDAYNKGFAASLKALQTTFVSDARVPLVLVFLSYADDESAAPATEPDVVEYYAKELLKLKNDNADLLRVYAANYMPVAPGATNASNRCAQATNNEIDISPATYEDRYFRLANRLNGETADICESGFASNFNLGGLQLRELPKRFALMGSPDPSTLLVEILKNGEAVTGFPWTFDPATREIVFQDTPPQGTSIIARYLPRGN